MSRVRGLGRTGTPRFQDQAGVISHPIRWGCWLAFLAWLTLTGTAAERPVHDDLPEALPVSGTSFDLDANLRGATREPFEPEHPSLLGMSVWWHWTAPQTGIYRWEASPTSRRVAVAVLTTDPLGRWNLVAETFLRPRVNTGVFGEVGHDPDPTGSLAAVQGVTYWWRLDGVKAGGFSESFPGSDPATPYPVSLQVRIQDGEPLLHDTFARRVRLGTGSEVLEGTLALATGEPEEPRGHPAALGRTLWWEWTAPGVGTATLRFATAESAPLIAVYRRGAWDQLEFVASSATEFGNECARFWRARDWAEFDTAAGETYFLQVDAFPETDLTRAFRGGLSFVPAPANDTLGHAVTVTGLDWSLLATNEGATASASDPRVPGQSGASSVWYQWTLPVRGLVQITTNEPVIFAEPGVEVLPPGGITTGSVFTTTPVPCSSPFEDLHPRPPFMAVMGLFRRIGSGGGLPILEFASQDTNNVWAESAGEEIWLQLDGPDGVTGTARLNGHLTPPPSNDGLEGRIRLPSAEVRVTGRSAGASTEPGELLPASALVGWVGSQVPRRSVWWEWRAPAAGEWVLRPLAGGYEHYFGVYRSTYQGQAEPAAFSVAPAARFHAEAGEVFQIAVFGLSGLGGNVEFTLTAAAAPPLGVPVLEYGAGDPARWTFPISRKWFLPFAAEMSRDLITWEPLAVDWVPGMEVFHLPFDGSDGGAFFRLRVR